MPVDDELHTLLDLGKRSLDDLTTTQGALRTRPGLALARDANYTAKHPVLLIPGFITSGLELWQGRECGEGLFRQRVWGTMGMMQSLLGNRTCWLEVRVLF